MNDAEPVILDLLRTLLGDKRNPRKRDMGLLHLVIDGQQHEPRCPRHQWLMPDSPRPDGDPCSARCTAAWAAIRHASAWLREHEHETQMPLLEGVG